MKLAPLASAWKAISLLWTPIYVDEGERIPKWYGCSRWIPYEMKYQERDPSRAVWKWRSVYYPIPVNALLAAYFWMIWLFKIGAAVPPNCYRSQMFAEKRHCPKCNHEFPTL